MPNDFAEVLKTDPPGPMDKYGISLDRRVDARRPLGTMERLPKAIEHVRGDFYEFKAASSQFPDSGYFSVPELTPSREKLELMAELLNYQPDSLIKEDEPEPTIYNEAMAKARGDAPRPKQKGYDPFRSQALARIIEDNIEPPAEGCAACQGLQEPFKELNVDWRRVSAIELHSVWLKQDFEARKKANLEEQVAARNEKLREIVNQMQHDPNFKDINWDRTPPYHFHSSFRTLSAGVPERVNMNSGVTGIGAGGSVSVGFLRNPERTGTPRGFASTVLSRITGTGTGSIQYVMDASGNAGLLLSLGEGVGVKSGIMGGFQGTYLWGVDNICDLTDIQYRTIALGLGRKKFAGSIEAGRMGATATLGVGTRGFTGSIKLSGQNIFL